MAVTFSGVLVLPQPLPQPATSRGDSRHLERAFTSAP